MGFFLDWTNFINLLKQNDINKDSFEFEIIPIKSLVNGKRVENETSYSFPFDLKLFDSYDLHPVKVYKKQKLDFCDVFVGSYFMSK